MQGISMRLKTMAEYIQQGATLADIGTDHAYLPLYAVTNDLVQKVIAGEVNQGPYLRAKAHIEQHRLSHLIDVRLGDGLDVVARGEVTTVTIAGMGGSLMVDILQAGLDKLQGIKRLILQPMGSEAYLREWLHRHNYRIVAEKILKEQDIIYEIIVADYGQPLDALTSIELQFGPFLLREKNQAFMEKWDGELQKKQRIFQNIVTNSISDSAEGKKSQLLVEIQRIKDVLSHA